MSLDFSWIKKLNETGSRFIRTCQECGHEQEDKEPVYGEELSNSFKFRKCKRCKSESLDYGSPRRNVYDDGE